MFLKQISSGQINIALLFKSIKVCYIRFHLSPYRSQYLSPYSNNLHKCQSACSIDQHCKPSNGRRDSPRPFHHRHRFSSAFLQLSRSAPFVDNATTHHFGRHFTGFFANTHTHSLPTPFISSAALKYRSIARVSSYNRAV